jgi:hypothetical protein
MLSGAESPKTGCTIQPSRQPTTFLLPRASTGSLHVIWPFGSTTTTVSSLHTVPRFSFVRSAIISKLLRIFLIFGLVLPFLHIIVERRLLLFVRVVYRLLHTDNSLRFMPLRRLNLFMIPWYSSIFSDPLSSTIKVHVRFALPVTCEFSPWPLSIVLLRLVIGIWGGRLPFIVLSTRSYLLDDC